MLLYRVLGRYIPMVTFLVCTVLLLQLPYYIKIFVNRFLQKIFCIESFIIELFLDFVAIKLPYFCDYLINFNVNFNFNLDLTQFSTIPYIHCSLNTFFSIISLFFNGYGVV